MWHGSWYVTAVPAPAPFSDGGATGVSRQQREKGPARDLHCPLQHEIVEAVWEDPAETVPGRPRRRYYRLTTSGAERVRLALAEAHATASPVGRLRPSPAGGLS